MNIFNLDISNGLVNHEIGAGEYIMLVKAPTAANVTVKANESFRKGIPLKEGHSLRAKKEIRNVYISCDAVPLSTITLMQADSEDDFELTTPPSSVDIDLIGGYEQVALTQLGKMFEPYEEPIFTSINTLSTIQTTIFNKALTCNKIKLILSLGAGVLTVAGNYAYVYAVLDGVIVGGARAHRTTVDTMHDTGDFELTISGVEGQTLSIVAQNTLAANNVGASVLEYNLKA